MLGDVNVCVGFRAMDDKHGGTSGDPTDMES